MKSMLVELNNRLETEEQIIKWKVAPEMTQNELQRENWGEKISK